jgi:hypothetical protein
MNETYAFYPPRRRGLLFHGGILLALGGASALAFYLGLNQQGGTFFAPFLILALLLFAPVPWIVYRALALSRASYRLERDGLRLRWGMRAEDIPLPDVEWIRRPGDLATRIPLPRLQWPGALLGVVNARDLGQIEYVAAETERLLLIATPRRIYAISPADTEAFLRTFQRTLEMGSLTPISSVSVLPAAYLAQIWTDKVTRALLAAGFILNLLLLVSVSLVIPGRVSTSLGFYPDGAPLPGVPSAQLLLLPILGAFMYVIDLAMGLFFYRREDQRQIAYMIWGSAPVSAALLIIGMLMMAGIWR